MTALERARYALNDEDAWAGVKYLNTADLALLIALADAHVHYASRCAANTGWAREAWFDCENALTALTAETQP